MSDVSERHAALTDGGFASMSAARRSMRAMTQGLVGLAEVDVLDAGVTIVELASLTSAGIARHKSAIGSMLQPKGFARDVCRPHRARPGVAVIELASELAGIACGG
jgi:hypothetical protein